MITTSVQHFASAIYDIAQETDQEKEYLDVLKELDTVWNENETFRTALAHPKISRDQKKEWLDSIFKEKLDPTMMNFLKVLVIHDQAYQIPAIYDSYLELYRKDKNIEEVVVESAAPLSDSQMASLKKVLEKKLNKKVELKLVVDPKLIAGLRVKAKDLVLDNTVDSRLTSLKEKINEK